ncbi:polysaccharide deacetylase family protein [Chloroflexota bacterium]
MIYISYQNRDFAPEIEYTFGVLFSLFGFDMRYLSYSDIDTVITNRDDILISYGKDRPSSTFSGNLHIYEGGLFCKDYLHTESIPPLPLESLNGLPVIFWGRNMAGGGASVAVQPGAVEMDADIIASSFFLLSRYEEVIKDARDKYDRFPAKASLAYSGEFLERPLVNEYAELLWNWLSTLSPGLKRKPLWPENREFAVCITHDVDNLRKYSLFPPVLTIGSALRRGKAGLAVHIVMEHLGTLLHLRNDPIDTFDYMLRLEGQYGFTSSFYFMAGGNSALDAGYSLGQPSVRRLITKIERTGCEVGLHGSHNSFNNQEEMASEKDRLDRLVSSPYGCRQHNLRWKTPNTWRVIEMSGLLYDTTVCFADHAGFRCGICHPFQPFDILERRRLEIWELPLTVMEVSLQNPEYQGLSPENAYSRTVKLIEIVKKHNGLFVLLWHNSSFDPLGGWAGWKNVYENLLEYVAAQNAFVGSGRDITLAFSK